jgi:hypothetical protein
MANSEILLLSGERLHVVGGNHFSLLLSRSTVLVI